MTTLSTGSKDVIYLGMGGGGDTLAAHILSLILNEDGNSHIMGVGEHPDIIKKMINIEHLGWTFSEAERCHQLGWEEGLEQYNQILKEKDPITVNVVNSLRLAHERNGKRFLFREGLSKDDLDYYSEYIKTTNYGFKTKPPGEKLNELKERILPFIQTKDIEDESDKNVRNPVYNTGWPELLISNDINNPVHILTVIGGTNEKYGNSNGKFSIEIENPKKKWDSGDIKSELEHIFKKFQIFQNEINSNELKTIMIDVGGDIVRKFDAPLIKLERDDIALRALVPVTRENNTVYVLGPGCDAHDDVDEICKRLYKAGFRRLGMKEGLSLTENLVTELTPEEEEMGRNFANTYMKIKPNETDRANGIFSNITMNPEMESKDFFAILKKRNKKYEVKYEQQAINSSGETKNSPVYFDQNKLKENKRKKLLHRTIWVNTSGFEVIDDKIQPVIDVEDYELEIIRTISIETPKVIENIITILDKAALAEGQLLEAREIGGGNTTLITKLVTTGWDKSKFYPKKQKIVELVLKDAHKAEEQKEEKESKGSDYIFYPKASRRVPMLDDNMGPTGWLLKHENYGGDSRINLFFNNNNSIIKLAKDYIDYRNRNIPLFFNIYVKALKGQSKNSDKLSSSIIEGFDSINRIIQEGKLDKDGLNGIGVDVLSFCQTWAKQNKETGDMNFKLPQFSVMSPHFQTRFYIKDLDLLNDKLNINFPRKEYCNVLKKFMSVMVDYNGSFVNIDELIKSDIAGGRRKRKLRKKKTKKTMKSRKKKKTRGGKKSRRRKKTRRKKTKRKKTKRRK